MGWGQDGDGAQQRSAPGCPAGICCIRGVVRLQISSSPPLGVHVAWEGPYVRRAVILVGICVQVWKLDGKFAKGEGALVAGKWDLGVAEAVQKFRLSLVQAEGIKRQIFLVAWK